MCPTRSLIICELLSCDGYIEEIKVKGWFLGCVIVVTANVVILNVLRVQAT